MKGNEIEQKKSKLAYRRFYLHHKNGAEKVLLNYEERKKINKIITIFRNHLARSFKLIHVQIIRG